MSEKKELSQEQIQSLNSRLRCSNCPAAKGEPCPFALERIHAMQAELNISKNGNMEVSQGCEWYINSAEYNYSFWNLAKELYGSPLSDKEICQLLVINQAQLREIYQSAIKKLIARKDEPEMQELWETIAELSASRNSEVTDYVPENFKDKMYEMDLGLNKEEEKTEEDPYSTEGLKPRKLNGMGMPIHRSGKRLDLYGLSKKKEKK